MKKEKKVLDFSMRGSIASLFGVSNADMNILDECINEFIEDLCNAKIDPFTVISKVGEICDTDGELCYVSFIISAYVATRLGKSNNSASQHERDVPFGPVHFNANGKDIAAMLGIAGERKRHLFNIAANLDRHEDNTLLTLGKLAKACHTEEELIFVGVNAGYNRAKHLELHSKKPPILKTHNPETAPCAIYIRNDRVGSAYVQMGCRAERQKQDAAWYSKAIKMLNTLPFEPFVNEQVRVQLLSRLQEYRYNETIEDISIELIHEDAHTITAKVSFQHK